MSTGPAIGIDLGTTYSCVGVFRDGVVEIIANEQGHRTTPSYVAFTNKERLIGDAAKNQAASNPTNTVFDVKRLIGRGFNDKEVQADIRHWPFKVVSSGEVPMIKIEHCGETKHFVAEQISAMNGKFEVKAVKGDTHLGGEDLTSRLVDHFVETFKKEKNGMDLTTNKKALSRLRKECEMAKRMLGSSESATVDIDSLFEGIDFIANISRVRFEQMCSDIFKSALDLVKKALNDAEMDKTYVHRTEGELMTTVIKRNTQIPTKETRLFQTHSDHQTSALIKVYEGECTMTRENNLLGEFMLRGLPRAPRGETKVEVTFEIDENGILHVSAVEPSTKRQNSITIVNHRGRLPEEEVERMLKEAEKFKQADEKERNRMSAMNSLVDYVYNIKKKMENEEIKNRTSVEYQHSVLAMCEEAVKWTDTEKEATQEDYEQMRQKFENVNSLIVAKEKLGSLRRSHE
ncbi:unnamed protein product [Taenia asiatica]|uniref:Heat shock protein 70 n=1 Tax=Taenia asiatica TaxID=60517 RepID=A0A0R3WG80_TAEAS|nr:unnamed protein product [Taenia asiatica]